jgi:hypothetical protein
VKGEPTICKVLPLYKKIESDMTKLALKHRRTLPDLAHGFELGAAKAKKYIAKALIGDYPLAGAGMLVPMSFKYGSNHPSVVLHPQLRLKYFENTKLWEPLIAIRARQVLEDLVDQYEAKMPASKCTHVLAPISDPTNSPIQKSAFDMAAGIGSDSDTDTDEYVSYLSPGHQQLHKYLDPKYMSKSFDFEGERVTIRQPLKWWMVSLSS